MWHILQVNSEGQHGLDNMSQDTAFTILCWTPANEATSFYTKTASAVGRMLKDVDCNSAGVQTTSPTNKPNMTRAGNQSLLVTMSWNADKGHVKAHLGTCKVLSNTGILILTTDPMHVMCATSLFVSLAVSLDTSVDKLTTKRRLNATSARNHLVDLASLADTSVPMTNYTYATCVINVLVRTLSLSYTNVLRKRSRHFGKLLVLSIRHLKCHTGAMFVRNLIKTPAFLWQMSVLLSVMECAISVTCVLNLSIIWVM